MRACVRFLVLLSQRDISESLTDTAITGVGTAIKSKLKHKHTPVNAFSSASALQEQQGTICSGKPVHVLYAVRASSMPIGRTMASTAATAATAAAGPRSGMGSGSIGVPSSPSSPAALFRQACAQARRPLAIAGAGLSAASGSAYQPPHLRLTAHDRDLPK